PETARMMLIGEQPGDYEDLAGRAFVGPAGQVLDEALRVHDDRLACHRAHCASLRHTTRATSRVGDHRRYQRS
ncbi:uracil-DNA glycosylase family protein, partial [Mycetohabitans sp. B6]|uniref:uracil-DNA glycosylase family protein n=1 Tax=Mycetohabitans sp. B6 TaxID=2841843 RepID=UPI00272C7AE7